jgi:hypothetical protein
MSPGTSWHLTITRLVPPVPGGRWLCALGIYVALIGIFWACGVFDPDKTADLRGAYGAALFFSVVLSYTVPILHYISTRTANAIDMLGPSLDAGEAQFTAWQHRVWHKTGAWFRWVLSIGIVSGLAHNLLLFGSPSELAKDITSSAPALAIFTGTCLIWIVLTLSMAALLDNALVFRDLARHTKINLLQPQTLRPFGTVAVISTLAVIGIQAAFPIMFIDSELSAVAYIPGLIPTLADMFLLAALPVWPVHRRLAQEKALALASINQRIDAAGLIDGAIDQAVDGANNNAEYDNTLAQLAPLLTYRKEIAQVSEWPFDLGVITRLGLYLIIPPLTWIGAALIERLVDDLV